MVEIDIKESKENEPLKPEFESDEEDIKVKVESPPNPVDIKIYQSIKKYRKKTKLSEQEQAIFAAYLSFGKVKTEGVKAFIKANTDSDPKNASLTVGISQDDEEILETKEDLSKRIDFLYSLHQFFTDHLILNPHYVDLEYHKKAPIVIKGFLTYLITTNNFKLLADDIQEAIELCDIAAVELPTIKELSLNLPGQFNRACSLLFGGQLFGMLNLSFCDLDTAFRIAGITLDQATELTSDLGDGKTPIRIEKISTTMAVVGIDKENYTVKFKQCKDSTEHLKFKKDGAIADIRFDQSIIDFVLVDTIIEADFHKLDCDVWYMDRVLRVQPPFVINNLPI